MGGDRRSSPSRSFSCRRGVGIDLGKSMPSRQGFQHWSYGTDDFLWAPVRSVIMLSNVDCLLKSKFLRTCFKTPNMQSAWPWLMFLSSSRGVHWNQEFHCHLERCAAIIKWVWQRAIPPSIATWMRKILININKNMKFVGYHVFRPSLINMFITVRFNRKSVVAGAKSQWTGSLCGGFR